MVRRVTWIQEEKHDRTVDRGRKIRGHVSGLQFHLHDVPHVEDGTLHEETIRKVHLPLIFLRIFSQ